MEASQVSKSRSEPKVVIGLPCYGGVDPVTVGSLLALYQSSLPLIYETLLHAYMYIDEARNGMVRGTLQLPAVRDVHPTHLLFLDADMEWPPDLLYKLLSYDKPVVGACYFRKDPPFDPIPYHLDTREYREGKVEILKELPKDGELMRVGGLGLGATLIRADVFRAMKERYRDEKWFCSSECGEDVHFFRRCLAMEIPVFLAGIMCGHLGRQLVTEQHWRMFKNMRLQAGV